METLDSVKSPTIKAEYSTEDDKTLLNEVPLHLFQYLPFSLNGYKLQNICRICLNVIEDTKVSLLSVHNNKMLIEMITAYTMIDKCEVYPDDNLPSYLCHTCKSDVIYCYEFKIKCEKSDGILQSLLIDKISLRNGNTHIPSSNERNLNDVDENFKDEVKEEIEIEVADEEYLEDFNDLLSESEALCMQNDQDHNVENFDITVTDSKNNIKGNMSNKKSPDKRFTCSFCYKKYAKAISLKQHVAKKHNSETYSHPCDKCNDLFHSLHDLQVHSAVHDTGPIWSCNKCQKTFKARAQLRRHTARHMLAKRFACDACGRSFSELYALRRHARVHTGEAREKNYACHLCDKRYSERHQLRAHAAQHAGERRCVCATCGKRFASARLLASHRLVHSDLKRYACSYCDKRFRHESTRNTHHRTHTGEKPYVCATCGKTFIQNSNLTLHMRTHTGERPYSCDKCDRKFTTGSSLKNHLWRHSGEKPYSCTVCGKRFARQDMSVHMRQHTGERPHACSACPKRFVSAARLREHRRMHTGEKPFECDTCTQKFSTKSHLVKHFKKHLDVTKKKCGKVRLDMIQKVNNNQTATLDNLMIVDGGQVQQPADAREEGTDVIHDSIKSNITLELNPEVPVAVTGELVVQDDCDVKEILVVDNSQNDANYQSGNICINTDGVNYVNSDVNLVTVNEGTTVKLYQLDQSLVQIHSSGGQVTISKITSKMTANF